jgi:hypothetical protein
VRVLKAVGLMTVLAAAVLFAGCGGSTAAATATATATATSTPLPAVPSPTSGFSTFKSPDGVYGLNYPSDWTSVADNTSPVVNGEIFLSADTKSYFMVLPLNQNVPSDQYGQFASSFAGGFGGTGTKISTTTSTTTFAGQTWTEVDGTSTVKGASADIKVYGTALGSNSLFIVTITPTDPAGTVESTDFQPMRSSFTLLKQS